MDPTTQRLMMGAAGGGSGIPLPVTYTLNSVDNVRTGDQNHVVAQWWTTNNTSGLFISTGYQTYQGYYAGTLVQNVTCTATLGGAAGGYNTNGRSISATFDFIAGDRLVFFAGKPTVHSTQGSQQGVGAGGGASVLALYTSSGFTPLIVAAGGSASHSVRQTLNCASPLSATSGANSVRNQTNIGNNGNQNQIGSGGVGRGTRGNTQMAGAGWFYRAQDDNSSTIADDSGHPDTLATGARGGNKTAISQNNNTNGSDGGFGGGGADADSNYYCPGGGGFYGGWECAGSNASQQLTVDGYSEYVWYTNSAGQASTTNNAYEFGPLSYVNTGVKNCRNVTDNGLHGSTTSTNSDSQQSYGRVNLVFS
jgi:hypothetical protein|tara:strand:- start:399 stop:1493 length:1095 start_codon:yes stop_codon:yes gene_type:complete